MSKTRNSSHQSTPHPATSPSVPQVTESADVSVSKAILVPSPSPTPSPHPRVELGGPSFALLVAILVIVVLSAMLSAAIHALTFSKLRGLRKGNEKILSDLKPIQTNVGDLVYSNKQILATLATMNRIQSQSSPSNPPANSASLIVPMAPNPTEGREAAEFLKGLQHGLAAHREAARHNAGNAIVDLVREAQSIPGVPGSFVSSLDGITRRVAPTAAKSSAQPPAEATSFQDLGKQLLELLANVSPSSAKATVSSSEEQREIWRQALMSLGYEFDHLLLEHGVDVSALSQLERRLSLLLLEQGVEMLKPDVGSSINLAQHEIVNQLRSSTVPPNTVQKVARRGYRADSQVISKAKIVMGVQ